MDYTFETFEVTGGNRAACTACREVADLRFQGEQPVLLLGPAHSGKSHLLWSIVQRVRARGGPTDLALVLAREFPDTVRGLLNDPRPIQRGRPAIFLVDELERFGPLTIELEKVVRLFLENGHSVILASNVHPSRLGALSRGFRALLQRGEVIEIAPRGAAPESGAGASPLEEANETLQAEALRARRELEQAREELAVLQHEAGELRRERSALQRRIAETADIEEELRDLKRGLNAARAEAEAAQSEQARLAAELRAIREADSDRGVPGALAGAVAEMRAELARTREDMEAAFAEQARLQGALSAYRLGFAADSGPPPSAEFQPRLDALCAHIEEQRAAFEQEEQMCREALSEFAAVLSRYEAAVTGAGMETGPPPDAPEQGRITEADSAGAPGVDEEAGPENTLQWTQDRLHGLARNLDALRGTRARQAAEAQALRQDLPGGAANVTADELERHLGGLESALAQARRFGRGDAPGESVDTLRALAAQIEALRTTAHPPSPRDDPAQALIFSEEEREAPPPTAAQALRELAAGAAPQEEDPHGSNPAP